jgi:biotin operon repressor
MPMRRKVCCECNKSLKKDEIALSQKLLGREIEEFYCINCLADYLECSTVDLLSKIQEFKEQGCNLFL